MKACLLALAFSLCGCATDARLLAENVGLKLQLKTAEEQLRQQQDYVAASEERDAQIQSDFQDAYKEMQEVWDDQVTELTSQARASAKRDCGA